MRPARNFAAFAVIWAIKMVILLDARPQIVKDTKDSTTLGNMTRSTNSTRERVRILTHPSSPIRGSIELGDEDIISDQDIIFPDSLESTYESSVGRLEVAPRCAGGAGTFCETIDSYPYGLLRDVLRRTKGHTDLLGMDETSDEIANRIGEQEENYICGAVDRTVYPKVGKTKNNKWKYIVNQGAQDGYVQGVRVETCRAVDKPCDLIDSLPDGYSTSCKQKFVYRRMLSISDGGQPVPDTFLMPSACCCAYKRDNRFLARFGSPPTTPVKRGRRLS